MDQTYRVSWSDTAIKELMKIYGYPDDIKERIYRDVIRRLSFTPKLTAKQISHGHLQGYWYRIGLYQTVIIFRVNEYQSEVRVFGIRHKRMNLYWKK